MDRSEVIYLLAPTMEKDEYGVIKPTYSEKRVFCQVDSVTRAEFFEGGRSGFNPDYKFTVFFGDYNGEPLVRYNGNTYSIYRTYHARTDILELYVERKGGSNGKEGVGE